MSGSSNAPPKLMAHLHAMSDIRAPKVETTVTETTVETPNADTFEIIRNEASSTLLELIPVFAAIARDSKVKSNNRIDCGKLLISMATIGLSAATRTTSSSTTSDDGGHLAAMMARISAAPAPLLVDAQVGSINHVDEDGGEEAAADLDEVLAALEPRE